MRLARPGRPRPNLAVAASLVGAIVAAALAVVLAAGCTGTIGPHGQPPGGAGGPGVTGGDVPPASLCTGASRVPGPAPLARLTDVEYRNTIRDLLPGVAVGALVFPSEIATEGFTNNAAAQSPSAELIEALQENAHAIATAAVADSARILPCRPAGAADEPACGQQFVQSFGKRAFRRPLRGDELTRYGQLFSTAYAQWGWQAALRLTIESMLQSPGFFYRVELGAAPPAGAAAPPGAAAPLDGYELASRLSYFLTDTMPDDALMAAADAGALATTAGVEAQARRLLVTSGAHDAVAAFHAQWLRFGKMDSLSKAADLFPAFGPEMASAMKQATALYVDDLFWNRGQTLEALLTDDQAYVNDALAPLYGVASPLGATLARVAVDPAQRSGILTQVGLLAGFAHERSDAPVLRGVLVLDRLLCQTPQAPPPGVNVALPDVDPAAPKTTRQQLEESHVASACALCHDTIDGIGFGFESYDAVGRWRTTDSGLPVDARGRITGTTDADGDFVGAVELGQRLARSDQVRTCVATQWLRYALGVTRNEAESCMVAPIAGAFAGAGYDLRELLVATVKSDAFRLRPAIAPSP